MTRRIAAVVLWAYIAWYVAEMVAHATGGPPEAGPVAAVLVVVLDLVGGARSHARRQTISPAVEAR